MIINNFIDEWKWLTNATLESTKQLNLTQHGKTHPARTL